MTRDPRNLMWAEACALLDRAEQLHRQFFEPARAGTRLARWEPPIDVFETEQQLRIIVALPGVAPEAAFASWVVFTNTTSTGYVSEELFMEMYMYQSNVVAVQNHSWGNDGFTQIPIGAPEHLGIENAA